MRRWLTGLALAAAAALLVSGCAPPDGVDGELTDDWPVIGAPAPFVPVAGACHAGDFQPVTRLSSYEPVDCATEHRVETVHVGTFTGAAGARNAPPATGSDDFRAAFAECDGKAREFVGDEWRAGRLWLGVSAPAPSAWSGGARWYRCDLVELSAVEKTGRPVDRRASLLGALAAADSPLRLTCFQVTLGRVGRVDTMPAIDCAKPHNSEFAGTWTAPASVAHPVRDRDWVPFYDGCYQRVAAYTGVPKDRNLRARTGVVTVPASAADWKAGDRGVRCYLWANEGRFTRSLKGAGPAGLPVQTR
jgi:hypothetical protein